MSLEAQEKIDPARSDSPISDGAKNVEDISVETGRPESSVHPDPFGRLDLVLSFIGITFAYLPIFASSLLVSFGLPILQQTFGQSVDIAFVPASNTIGQCIGFFVCGLLSDFFGRRWFLIAGNALAMIGYMVAGRAHNLATNIGGSFVFGLGTSMQLLGVMFALELVAFNRRYLAYTLISTAWGPVLSIAGGTIFTFVANADESWRWVHYICFIASFVSMALVFLFYRPELEPADISHNKTHMTSDWKKIDYIGTVLWIGCTISFVLGAYLGGQRYPWQSARTIVPLVIGACGWIVALIWEFFNRSRYNTSVLSLLKKRNYTTLTFTVALIYMAWTAPTMLWSQQIATLLGGGTLVAGWYYGIAVASPILGQIIAGVMVTGLPFVQIQLIVGTVLVLALVPALAAYTVTRVTMAVVLLIAGGVGVGITDVICVVGSTSVSSPHEFGLASGFLWMVRKVAISVATAIYTDIFNRKVQENLQTQVVPVLIQGGLDMEGVLAFLQALQTGDPTAFTSIPGITPELIETASAAAKGAFADSFKIIYLISIAFAATGLLVALLPSNAIFEKGKTAVVAKKLRGFPNPVSARSLL